MSDDDDRLEMPGSITYTSVNGLLPKTCRFLAITYNVAGKLPNKLTVDHVIKETTKKCDFNFCVVSLQETRTGERFGIKSADNWRELFTEAMWELNYIPLCANYMMTNLLIVFGTPKVAPGVHSCHFSYSKDLYNGAKGTIGVVVRLDNDQTFMCLGSHFAHAPERNHIRISQAENVQKLISKAKHRPDGIIWLGDLNFRNIGISDEDVASFTNENTDLLAILKAHDQLTTTGRPVSAFRNFEEAEIKFRPTYKMTMGTGDYDPLRTPSWTDRILTQNFVSELYTSLRSATYSDHQPVFSKLRFDCATEKRCDWTVRFEATKVWYTGVPFRICFQGKDFWHHGGSVWDWLGVYRAPHIDPNCVVTYTNVMLCVDYGTHYLAEFMSLLPGRYVVVYHSHNRGCIKGMSQEFSVEELKDAS